jgi:hypothetical protein
MSEELFDYNYIQGSSANKSKIRIELSKNEFELVVSNFKQSSEYNDMKLLANRILNNSDESVDLSLSRKKLSEFLSDINSNLFIFADMISIELLRDLGIPLKSIRKLDT